MAARVSNCQTTTDQVRKCSGRKWIAVVVRPMQLEAEAVRLLLPAPYNHGTGPKGLSQPCHCTPQTTRSTLLPLEEPNARKVLPLQIMYARGHLARVMAARLRQST